MAGELSGIRRNAVLLRDDQLGVATENKPRKIQSRAHNGGYDVSINADWLEQLNMGEQGEPTVHSLSLGIKPVIVQNPAIIIQPIDVLENDS